MELKFSWQIFEKYSNIKFHENTFSGSRVVACGWTDGRTDRQTDMPKLLVDFRNFAKCLKITSKVAENYETFVLHSEMKTQKIWRENSCIPFPVTQTVVWCHQSKML